MNSITKLFKVKYKCLSAFLLLFSVFVYSQENGTEGFTQPTIKGNWIITGGSNFSFRSTSLEVESNSQEIDNGNTLSISLGAGAGYFIIDNLAIGLELPVSFSRFKDEDIGFETKTTSFIASPFVRYYFNGSNIRPYVQANIGFGSSKTTIEDAPSSPDPIFQPSDNRSNVFQYSFNGGIAIFISQNVSIDLGVVYSRTNTEPEDSDLKFKNSTIWFFGRI